MPNMSPTKTPMPHQPADVRNKNFSEVSLGYTEEMALNEAARCLGCKHRPCVAGCPVGVPIPEFITQLKVGNIKESGEILSSTNRLPAVCGRVCPQEAQCEKYCVRGIKGEPVAIGRLERFVADQMLKMENQTSQNINPNGHKVAVVGSGPAGLTCAGELAAKGYAVTVFEALHIPGGVLSYGIPEFRLPKAIVAKEVENLKMLGVELRLNTVIGRTVDVDELFERGFEAVFIGSGAGLPTFMNIPGEELIGVYSANEYLTRVNLMKAYDAAYDTPIRKSERVAVVGGGNVAMDAARCAKRLGAEEVSIIYRRGREEMPARQEEILHAEEEGIVMRLLTNPNAILADKGEVSGISCVEMELGEPDKSGRRSPVVKVGSDFVLPVDTVIMAIGTSPNPLIGSTTPAIQVDSKGRIIVTGRMASTMTGVYAGGDAVTGAATVILAMGAGKEAAASIDKFIKNT